MKLDIGCGPVLEAGWVGVDPFWNPPPKFKGHLIRRPAWDIGEPDESIEFIRCFHALEHLAPEDIRAALVEWARLLVPGGGLEIAVPDAVYCLQHFMDHPYSPWAYTMIHGRNEYPGDRHLTAFAPDTLRSSLESTGFRVIACDRRWTQRWNQVSICAFAVKPGERDDDTPYSVPDSAYDRSGVA